VRTDLSAAIGADSPTLAFDGDCGFCQATITWLQHHARPRMRATPWHPLPDHITWPHRERLDREVLVFRGADVNDSGAQALGAPVIRKVARLVHRLVAAHRHRMPTGTAACALPRTHDGSPT